MSNSNSSRQVLLSVIGVAILVVAVVGVSFAFFNYTRTGQANTIRTGTITFNSENSAIRLTNVFPIAKSTVDTDVNNVGTGTVSITGYTTYVNGMDFKVTVQNVSTNIGTAAGKLPVSVKVSTTNLDSVTAFGSDSGSMTVNSYEDGTTIAENDVLVQGRIPTDTNVNGTITIKAYIDRAAVAITDTYPERTVRTVKTTGYSSSTCQTALTGEANATTYCATASSLQDAIDNEDITSAQITALVNAGLVEEYTDGTTSTWVDGRTVMTTTEWNALSSTPASFKIKVVADEGAAS